MEQRLQQTYVRQIHYQVQKTELAIAEHEAADKGMILPGGPLRLGDAYWRGLEDVIGAAAIVSKILWGGGGRKKDERRPLRILLQVTDNSPIRDTAMRNHLEHIDERVAQWWETSTSRNFYDRNIGFTGAAIRDDLVNIFRNYDPDSGQLIFWGECFDFPSIVQEMRRIGKNAVGVSDYLHLIPPHGPGRT